MSEADRTQLPYLQAFILSTKSRISYILPWSGMDPIFNSEGAVQPEEKWFHLSTNENTNLLSCKYIFCPSVVADEDYYAQLRLLGVKKSADFVLFSLLH